jgi:hypothetical protein
VLSIHQRLPVLSDTHGASMCWDKHACRLLGAIDLQDATYAGPKLVTDCSLVYFASEDSTVRARSSPHACTRGLACMDADGSGLKAAGEVDREGKGALDCFRCHRLTTLTDVRWCGCRVRVVVHLSTMNHADDDDGCCAR